MASKPKPELKLGEGEEEVRILGLGIGRVGKSNLQYVMFEPTPGT